MTTRVHVYLPILPPDATEEEVGAARQKVEQMTHGRFWNAVRSFWFEKKRFVGYGDDGEEIHDYRFSATGDYEVYSSDTKRMIEDMKKEFRGTGIKIRISHPISKRRY